MKTTHTKIEFTRLPKDYTGLCRMLTPRPIHDKVDFENVTEITNAMAGHKLTADQEDYFDLLCRLIEDYDKEHTQLDTPNRTCKAIQSAPVEIAARWHSHGISLPVLDGASPTP